MMRHFPEDPQPEVARLSSKIATLFPPGVMAAELRGRADISALYPDEARFCAGFSAKRTADFAAGRLCARRALREFGHHGFALTVNADRRPHWPEGLLGSISHTTDFCGAVVAPSAAFESLGFDAESIGGVGEDLWPALFTASEIARLGTLERSEQTRAATIAFSAKEAYYKCHYGITASWLDFTDVEVTLDERWLHSGTFGVRPAKETRNGVPTARSGRYALDDKIVLTGVAALRE